MNNEDLKRLDKARADYNLAEKYIGLLDLTVQVSKERKYNQHYHFRHLIEHMSQGLTDENLSKLSGFAVMILKQQSEDAKKIIDEF